LPCYDIPGNPPPYYPQGLGSCGDVDLDFGANPNLFTDARGRTLVGVGQKSGIFHAIDTTTMQRAWTVPVGPPSSVGGVVGSTALPDGFVIAFRPGGGGGTATPPPGGGGGGGGGGPSSPAGPTIVAGPGAYATTYATPAVVIPQGGSVSFASLDLPQHDVVA